jgi:hypothetical protein
LLEEFDKRGNELTWNTNGTIFIDEVAIPGSNLFTLFPLLFKLKRSEKLIGLSELIEKINDMGLSPYIVEKKSFNIAKQPEIMTEKKKVLSGHGQSDDLPWYYLGP